MEKLLDCAKDAIASGKILPESRSKVVYSHAIERLRNWRVLEVSYEQTAKKSAKYLTKIADIPRNALNTIECLASLMTD